MIRRLYCKTCADKTAKELPGEDKAEGRIQRFVNLRIKRPKEHHVEITNFATGNVHRVEIPELVCDFCNQQLPNGTEAVAWTMWRGEEPGKWE